MDEGELSEATPVFEGGQDAVQMASRRLKVAGIPYQVLISDAKDPDS